MLLTRIDAFLRRTKMSPTRFGREAVRDPNFVLNLRDGREPRRATRRRVLAYIDQADAALAAEEMREFGR
jgi:2,4-dienoyl-CoA reductase-like NADH-dependent reductase (Old Yellow Enzyme family)